MRIKKVISIFYEQFEKISEDEEIENPCYMAYLAMEEVIKETTGKNRYKSYVSFRNSKSSYFKRKQCNT